MSHKTIHADFRIKSIEDDPSDAPTPFRTTHVVKRDGTNAEAETNRKRAAAMQLWWEEGISKNMDLPDGYEKVAVLLVKWDDALDELKTREEAEELQAMFRDRFYYDTELVHLNVSSKPQLQLNRYLNDFVENYDGPTSLLIVYYTGHGVYREDRSYLELTAFEDPDSNKGSRFKKEAHANWNSAEAFLRSDVVEGDVLTILDTCYASNHTKSGNDESRTFELLSACAINETTAAPGKRSFTRALLVALDKLLKEFGDKPFTTARLNQDILRNPLRHGSPSQLWLYNERHVRLAPLKPWKDRKQKSFPLALSHPPRGYLTLRFALRHDSLNREQIEFLTKKLSEAFNNKQVIGLRRIDWLGLKPARTTPFGRAALALFAMSQWTRIVKKKREERRLQSTVDNVRLPRDMSVEPPEFAPSPTRKRTHDVIDDLPKSKRGSLVRSQTQDKPPSPPVSISSRMDVSGDGVDEAS
ncbi:hypothetical protein K505DRAFT_252417 [Melanomma pulvis-pyrius CBS 109.77]|uniref:Uncharacterized protein n=1 Tax=Melanomma pulvis-pyrius CBS 109.77 TaxID=1314802 RepID=A0A6A6X0J8_9PLEO|nr:hypothetical protein K505DRAFT_252417 [Melanomma pulvis-pyrius CBS 109.77]